MTSEKKKNSQRKTPGLDDQYEHAPRKPDSDPWAVLLKPELEADKMRCDAWKEEVQNLLIFAGLFSAVVTAFVIESYKFLQPDPNDAIISLLSQIANGPNSTLSRLSGRSSTSTIISFTQASSSVRINVFWFISLILSLTTVLIGTIALQWLREHQSYHGFSPKETLAILYMRSEALNRWYVPQIFAALPLLLQGALVLFLAGLIEFTLPLGMKLTIPVACITGFILLFLAATTALPAYQALFLLSGALSRDTVPTPCAFKSPQSQVFRTLFEIFLRFFSLVFPKIYLPEKRFWKYENILPEESGQRHLFPYIYTIWHRRTWPTFDFEWLYLRDAWHNGILDKDTDLYGHRQKWEDAFFPLSDITQCLVKVIAEPTNAKHTEDFLVAACYCFQEISASVWEPGLPVYEFRTDRRNNYFEQLHHRPWYESELCSISKFFIHGGKYKYDRFPDDIGPVYHYMQEHHALFYQDQICLFLDMLLEQHTSTALEPYHQEIKSRITTYLLKSNIGQLIPTPNINDVNLFHALFVSDTEDHRGFITLADSVDLLMTVFRNVASSRTRQDQLISPLYTHSSMTWILDTLAGGIIFYLQSIVRTESDTPNQQCLYEVGDQYNSIFHSVARHLKYEISTSEMSSTPSLLFNLSAILLQRLFFRLINEAETIPQGKIIGFCEGLSVLVGSLAKYKEQRIDQSNLQVDTPLKGQDFIIVSKAPARIELTDRFSNEWWAALFRDYDDSGLRRMKNGPVISSSTPLDIILQPTPDETHPSNLDIASSTPAAISLNSSNTADIAGPSASVSKPDVINVSNAMPNSDLDVPPPGKMVEHPIGVNVQSSSSSPLLSDLIVCSDGSRNPKTGDSVIDIQPPK